MENKLISLIVVTYQAEKYIEKTLQNLIQQDYLHKEIIVIDGKSSDNTVAIIEKYQKHLAYFVSEPDNGLYFAMNKGLQAANGDYVLFVNAGDMLYNEKVLSHCMEHCSGADIIYGDTVLLEENYQFLSLRRLRPPRKLQYKHFLKGMLVSHQAFMAKRAITPLFNTNYRYSADFDWCVQILKSSSQICNSEITMAGFMLGGQTSRTIWPGLKERFRIMTMHYGLTRTLLSHVYILWRYLGSAEKLK